MSNLEDHDPTDMIEELQRRQEEGSLRHAEIVRLARTPWMKSASRDYHKPEVFIPALRQAIVSSRSTRIQDVADHMQMSDRNLRRLYIRHLGVHHWPDVLAWFIRDGQTQGT